MRLDVNTNHPKFGELLELASEISGFERLAKESRGKLAEAQKRLAQIACPYVRGSTIRYNKGDEERVAMISEIQFSPDAPHYKLTVRTKKGGQISSAARLICLVANNVRSNK